MGESKLLLCLYRYLEDVGLMVKLEKLKIQLCLIYSRFLIILLPNRS